MNTRTIIKFTPWLVILIAGILYIFTLDSGLRPEELTGGDLITHQYAQVQARPGNAPGYPLYTMLGWLSFRAGRALLGWALNPIQTLSLYSALWGLASLWVLYHILYRPEVSGQNWLLSALLTLFYAVTYFFWYYSVTTEQYTSAIFQTLLLVWLSFEWERCPSLPLKAIKNSRQADERRRTAKQDENKPIRLASRPLVFFQYGSGRLYCKAILLAMAFISGAMLANMLTTLFILPPLLYLIFTRRPAILKDIKLVALSLIAGLLPLLSYAYVYIRGAQHPEWRGAGDWLSTAEWFWQFISIRQGRDELGPGLTLNNLLTPEYPSLIWGELTWIVLVGGLAGCFLLGKRKAIFFYGTLAIYLAFSAAYRFGNWFQVILPVYPLLLVGFGRSVGWVWEKTNPPSPIRGRGKLLLRAALTLALLILIAYRFTASVDELRRIGRHNLPADAGLDPGWAVLADAPPAGASVSGDFEEWIALQYLNEIWSAEPKISLQKPGQAAEYITRRAALAFPELLDLNRLIPQSAGATLIHLSNKPLSQIPPEATPLNIDFGGQMRLVGLRPIAFSPQRSSFIFYWTTAAPMAKNYTISLRLWQNGEPLEGDDGPLIQDHQPVWNLYPTTRWQPGSIVADAYNFTLPLGAVANQLHLVIYHQTEEGFENLGDALINLPSWP